MSTATNTDREYEGPYDDWYGDITYQIDDHSEILAHIVTLRHPYLSHGIDFNLFNLCTGAGLWGVLRRLPVEDMYVSICDDTAFVVVFFEDENDPVGQYKMDSEEYEAFEEFCVGIERFGEYIEKEPKINWIKEGF